ncbi:hypothetical protein RB195_007239 [Necator americanus]|uniref:Uncharacterized protein n=1 Tax=Necator americanus TaxID=51031 RepID=A0ABR1BZ33_NECAM
MVTLRVIYSTDGLRPVLESTLDEVFVADSHRFRREDATPATHSYPYHVVYIEDVNTAAYAKRPRGRPPTRWGEVFAARMDQLRAQLDTAQGPRQRHSRSLRTSWMTMARERNEWKRCWGPHVE